ncbi:hypothetical protein WP5W18E02_02880 [Aeromonas caviae]|nr:hypothetical protein WP5W18E02_02880 [Aeromonas caviae]
MNEKRSPGLRFSMPYPSRTQRPRALPSLANKGLYRQLTAATTLCTGRAAPLSTCGNKPVCGNALLVTNKNGARGSVFPCRIHPGRSTLALPSLANKDLHRQLTAATTLCTGRAASLSTCGNKPACGNALIFTNKNGARGSVLPCRIHPGRSALARFPPLPTRGCTASSRRQRRCALTERHHYPPVVINLPAVMHV